MVWFIEKEIKWKSLYTVYTLPTMLNFHKNLLFDAFSTEKLAANVKENHRENLEKNAVAAQNANHPRVAE